MRWSLPSGAYVLALVMLTACGGAAPQASQPQEPPSQAPPPGAPGMMPTGEPTTGQPAEPGLAEDEPSLPDSDKPAQQPVGGMTLDLADDLGGLFDQFRTAESELQQAGNVCSRACRALLSMERASSRMCKLASSPDEKDRCGEATERYRQARDRVRKACRSCPEGPALDVEPDAG